MKKNHMTSAAILASEWQSWVVVRHFLPAFLQRMLAAQIVSIATNGRVSLSDLFEEVVTAEPLWSESWMIRARPGIDKTATYLQNWVRSVVWQNDDRISFSDGGQADSSGAISASFLEALSHLAAIDLEWSSDVSTEIFANHLNKLQPGIKSFGAALKIARTRQDETESVDLWVRLADSLAEVEMPLQALLGKHIADLLADADAWHHALEGYRLAESMLAEWPAPREFAELRLVWQGLAFQSRAAAMRIVHVEPTEKLMLQTRLKATALDTEPMLVANAGVDALSEESTPSSTGYRDFRVASLNAPLREDLHEPTAALRYWIRGKHEDAARHFWALLRRQIALGALAESRVTKAMYARAILDRLISTVDHEDADRSFEMAVRLLVEAGNSDAIERIEWHHRLIDKYVPREGFIERLIAHARVYPGSQIARTKVLVGIFTQWTLRITPLSANAAVKMWQYVALVARTLPAAFESEKDVGRPALRALRELGKKRPELRTWVVGEVTDAVCVKLSEEFVWGRTEAIDTVGEYVDMLNEVRLDQVVSATLTVLQEEDPKRDFWPLSRAALNLLVDPKVRKRLRLSGRFEEECLKQILRFGLTDGSGQMMLFFHLADFDEQLLSSAALKKQTRGALAYVRKGALETSSSSATDHIRALFVAPFIAGKLGIADGFRGLSLILRSARKDYVSIGLPYVDSPVMLLVEQLNVIQRVLHSELDWLATRLTALSEEFEEVWKLAEARPELFAPFAFPPRSTPSGVLVHNCAYASLRLAAIASRTDQMNAALDAASRNSELRGAISLARATLTLGGGEQSALDLDLVIDDRDTFYEVLGRRLLQLERLTSKDARALCRGLVADCLRFGPRPADAALLIAAARLGLHKHVQESGLGDYITRVREDRETRLFLLPILDLFSSRSTTPDFGETSE